MKAKVKIVLPPHTGTMRVVYSNPKSGVQVAIGTVLFNGLKRTFQVSVPIEGKGGWTRVCTDLGQVERTANRECSVFGKMLNRLVVCPISFVRGRLA